MSDFEDDAVIMSGDEAEAVKEEPLEQDTEDVHLNDDNIMKILIASDIHLGYEQTTKRAQEDDSFRTFEEILQYAKEKEVDLVLLGGDLFHEAKPPHNVVMKCINLLRTYCLSDKPVKIQFLTDPETIFNHCFHKKVNYEDPNLNIGIPIFSIHGNHDDPSFGAVGSMDVLSSTGLINYFGKWTDVTQVSLVPIVLQKGITTVSIYGLSYMNDQRLSRLLRNHKLEMMHPKNIESSFSIFVLHQNRAQHSQNAYVPEELLPDFVNLVVWGHEHECLIEAQESKVKKGTYICQPGSSVATSLAQGESVTKHVGLLSVYKDKFKMELLKLNTVRAFVFDDLVLNDHADEISKYKSRSEAVEEFVDNYIENTLIPQAAEQQTGHPKQPEKPLLRLRIFYSQDRDVFETLRLSQKYYQVIANPNDMILFKKCSSKLKKNNIKVETDDLGQVGEIFRFDTSEKDWKRTVLGGMTEYFSQDDKINKLTVLSLAGLNEALSRFVNANDTKSFEDLTRHQMKKTLKNLVPKNLHKEDEIIEAIRSFRDSRFPKEEEEENEEENENASLSVLKTLIKNSDSDSNVEDEPTTSKGRGRGRGRARGRGATVRKAKEPAGSTPSKRGRGKMTAIDITMDKSNRSTSSWKKPSQSTKKIISLDSDSDD